MREPLNTFAGTAIAAALLALSGPTHAQLGPVTGAVFTTGVGCVAVNSNIYDTKDAVYLDGGPARPGSAGLLSLTSYYVQVTDPSGATVLGSSVNNTGSKTPITTNALGDVVGCFQLQSIVSLASHVLGYDDTPNAGGEYKVWVSTDPSFTNKYTKTDNFKVKGSERPTDTGGTITIVKFYDANADGVQQSGEPVINDAVNGWKVDLLGYASKRTEASYPGLSVIGNQTYTAREYQPLESNWYSTAPVPLSTTPFYLNQFTVQLTREKPSYTVEFGNVCTGAGGGYTLGFWSNKNGQKAIDAHPGVLSALINSAYLANADGTRYYAAGQSLSSWLLNATAKNMAYMLSAQYAAMYLNIYANPGTPVAPNAIIAAAGTASAAAYGNGTSGFAPLSWVMAEAVSELAAASSTPAGTEHRAVQESIKTALDMANNNRTFVQPTPCAFTFAP